MKRYDAISMLIEKNTGRKYDENELMGELIARVKEGKLHDGEQWVTGFNDDNEKRTYHINVERLYDDEVEMWYTTFLLLEVLIKDKKQHKKWIVKVHDVKL